MDKQCKGWLKALTRGWEVACMVNYISRYVIRRLTQSWMSTLALIEQSWVQSQHPSAQWNPMKQCWILNKMHQNSFLEWWKWDLIHLSSETYSILWPQSRQSAKLFLKSSELGLPQPLTRSRVCPPPPPPGSGGGAHSLAREGLGESQFRRRDIVVFFIYGYFVIVTTVQHYNPSLAVYVSNTWWDFLHCKKELVCFPSPS